ncbi:hypothetical protein C8F01DRAFT_1259992 [Mycena amicta]|nr:hypothetical protein C8F01DRAFT_1259992 [Mycena amicta]
MFNKYLAILAAFVVSAQSQNFMGTAIEFHPDSAPEACGFVIEPEALALLLSRDTFNTTLCGKTAAVEFNSTVQPGIPIAGICFSCAGENIALSTEAYISLGAPEETVIDVVYTFV